MRKVVILGSQGNLGTSLIKEFSKEEEFQVIGWDKEDVDITDRELITGKIKEVGPNIIINTAAYNAVDKCEEEEAESEKAEMINSRAVGYLAEAALEIGATVIHFSTDYVFSGEKKEGYTENEEPDPVNGYGRTKRGGEKELIARSGEGLKWYLIRTSKLFGPAGDSPEAKLSFFDKILSVAEEQEEIKVVAGEEISCFTYTPDLALKTKDLIESNTSFGIYHITNSGAVDWRRGAEEVLALTGRQHAGINPVTSADINRPAKRPKYSILINTKLEPLRSWQEALREYYGKIPNS